MYTISAPTDTRFSEYGILSNFLGIRLCLILHIVGNKKGSYMAGAYVLVCALIFTKEDIAYLKQHGLLCRDCHWWRTKRSKKPSNV